jgi:hypothetical protein
MGATDNKGYDAAKGLGTGIIGNLQSEYAKGPQVFDKSLYTPMSGETTGLIGQGLGDVANMRGGVVGDVAGGQWLGGANPYFENALARTRENVGMDVNSTFNSSGLFGSDLHAKGLAQGMGNVENDARMANFENEYGRMMGAQGALQKGTATGLGYSGMMDADAQARQLGDFDLFTRQTQAPFQQAGDYLGLLNDSADAPGVAKEKPWWESVLGAGLGLAGGYLSGGYSLPFGIGKGGNEP